MLKLCNYTIRGYLNVYLELTYLNILVSRTTEGLLIPRHIGVRSAASGSRIWTALALK